MLNWKERLNIVLGVRKFHQYLYGKKFTLLTDYQPLTTIVRPHAGIPSLAASRLQGWALLLSAHSYDIKYHKSDSQEVRAFCPVRVFAMGKVDDYSAVTCKNVATVSFRT